MISTALIAHLVFGVLAHQDPTREELHGKNSAEIVKMGHDAWYQFYVDREGGETTMSMAFAESHFGWAMKVENDKILFTKSMDEQDFINFLRLNMLEFESNAVDIARSYTGGGTMWTPVSAAIQSRVEEVVSCLLGAKCETSVSKQASVWSSLKKVRVDLRAAESDIRDGEQYSRIKYEDLEKGLARMFELFQRAVDRSSQKSTQTKSRIFNFYIRAAELGHQFELEPGAE